MTERRTRQDPRALRGTRQARGMKVGQLAGQVGTAVQTLYNAETGSGTLSIELLQRIAEALTKAGRDKGLAPVTVDDLLRNPEQVAS